MQAIKCTCCARYRLCICSVRDYSITISTLKVSAAKVDVESRGATLQFSIANRLSAVPRLQLEIVHIRFDGLPRVLRIHMCKIDHDRD